MVIAGTPTVTTVRKHTSNTTGITTITTVTKASLMNTQVKCAWLLQYTIPEGGIDLSTWHQTGTKKLHLKPIFNCFSIFCSMHSWAESSAAHDTIATWSSM